MNEFKSEVIQIRLTPEEKETLKKLAAAENRTVSNYIITKLLNKNKEGN